MPLSDFFSRRNNKKHKKQLRTNWGPMEQFFCRPTAKKLIGPIIIKKTVISKMHYIAIQGTCQCHLVISFPAEITRNNWGPMEERSNSICVGLQKKKVIGPIIKKTVIRKIRYIAMQGTCQCHLVISFPAEITRNNWGPMEERSNSICVGLQKNLKKHFFRLCSPCPGNMKRPAPPGK